MMTAVGMANAIKNALSQKTDGEGKPFPMSSEGQEYASGLLAALQASVITFAPGTITGVTAAGAPLSAGAGAGGVGVYPPPVMIAKTSVAFHHAPLAAPEHTAFLGYLATLPIAFNAGDVTGQCTNTAESPGPLVNGAATGGFLVGASGVAAAAFVGAIGPDQAAIYQAILDYMASDGEVVFPSGTITGTCPSGGGPLAAGAGAGGTWQ